MCLTLPDVLVSVVGIEKVVPAWADLKVFLRLLPAHRPGERMNPYTSTWTGVIPGDGPQEVHVVLLDNGRTNVLADQIGNRLDVDGGPGQGRRVRQTDPVRVKITVPVVAMPTGQHICVIRADQIVADVPDATTRLDPSSVQTWISGPSATSDIELTRVEGVHGPRHLHVVVVNARG
jgi:L-lactate utilization protein LutB